MNLILDVSNNNTIDEPTLRRSGAEALIAKATEGTTFVDAALEQHRQAARNAGVPFGSYLFLHPSSSGNEAGFYLEHAHPRPGDLQPMIDCEVSDGQSLQIVAGRAHSCALELERNGYRPLLYGPGSFLQSLFGAQPLLRRLHVWEAQYPGRFTRWAPAIARLRYRLGNGASVVLWQWTELYAVGGRYFDASRLLTGLDNLLIPA